MVTVVVGRSPPQHSMEFMPAAGGRPRHQHTESIFIGKRGRGSLHLVYQRDGWLMEVRVDSDGSPERGSLECKLERCSRMMQVRRGRRMQLRDGSAGPTGCR